MIIAGCVKYKGKREKISDERSLKMYKMQPGRKHSANEAERESRE